MSERPRYKVELPVHRPAGPRRSCGACTECCTVMMVPELNKPAGTPCVHLVPGKGCGIYADRPQSCRDFECLWLQGAGDTTTRPDRSGAVLGHMDDTCLTLYVRPEQPERWKRSAFLRRLADGVVEAGRTLYVVGGTTYRRMITSDPLRAQVGRELIEEQGAEGGVEIRERKPRR